MLNVNFTGKNKQSGMLDKAATEFARKELAPNREENDKYPFGSFFKSALKKAFVLDFFGIMLPEEFNGMDMGIKDFSLVLENICQEDSSLGGIMITNCAAQQIMLDAGTDEMLKEICSAKNVYNFLIAFPSFNNPLEMAHKAEVKKDSSGYRISGSLEYLVLGGIAEHGLIPAKIEGQENYSYFLVNLSDNGVFKSEPILSLGLRSCPAVDIYFDNVGADLVGEEDKGEYSFKKMTDTLNVAAAAMSVGIMKGSFQEAFAYSQERLQGGQEIIKWSELKMMIADMAISIKNADMSLSMACHCANEQQSGWEQCALAAVLEIQRKACDVTTDGIQAMGGVGYMRDFGQEKRFRDACQVQSLFGIAPVKRINYLDSLMR